MLRRKENRQFSSKSWKRCCPQRPSSFRLSSVPIIHVLHCLLFKQATKIPPRYNNMVHTRHNAPCMMRTIRSLCSRLRRILLQDISERPRRERSRGLRAGSTFWGRARAWAFISDFLRYDVKEIYLFFL